MTVNETVKAVERELSESGVPSARAEAEILTAAVLGITRSRLGMAARKEILRPQAEGIRSWVTRRASREPLQLILGYAPFFDLEITVKPGAFIPRPETEGLARLAVELTRGTPDPVLVEACAGTAAAALWFLRERPDGKAVAVEKDPVAIECAALTAGHYGIKIALVRGNLLDALGGSLKKAVDVVIANPPYVPTAQIRNLPPEVRDWEPAEALDGGPDGLKYYGPICRAAARLLKPGGRLAFEVGFDGARAVTDIIINTGAFTAPVTARDLAGVERYVCARRLQGRTGGLGV